MTALIAASDAEFPALFQALINHTREHFIAEGQLMRAAKFAAIYYDLVDCHHSSRLESFIFHPKVKTTGFSRLALALHF